MTRTRVQARRQIILCIDKHKGSYHVCLASFCVQVQDNKDKAVFSKMFSKPKGESAPAAKEAHDKDDEDDKDDKGEETIELGESTRVN